MTVPHPCIKADVSTSITPGGQPTLKEGNALVSLLTSFTAASISNSMVFRLTASYTYLFCFNKHKKVQK